MSPLSTGPLVNGMPQYHMSSMDGAFQGVPGFPFPAGPQHIQSSMDGITQHLQSSMNGLTQLGQPSMNGSQFGSLGADGTQRPCTSMDQVRANAQQLQNNSSKSTCPCPSLSTSTPPQQHSKSPQGQMGERAKSGCSARDPTPLVRCAKAAQIPAPDIGRAAGTCSMQPFSAAPF